MQDDFNISRRKTLAALGTIGAASAGAGLGTSAYFSDQETFQNNSLTAGTLDMKVDWEEHYSDWSADEDDPADSADPELDIRMDEPGSPENYTAFPPGVEAFDGVMDDDFINGDPLLYVHNDDVEQFMVNTSIEAYPDEDDDGVQDDFNKMAACETLADVGNDDGGLDSDLRTESSVGEPLVNLDDVKPGDFGEVTFSFHLCDNPGYVWLNGELIEARENGNTEPEADDPDEEGPTDEVSNTVQNQVELLDEIQTAWWYDANCNNRTDGEATTSGEADVVIVMDTSGSMGGTPLDNAKTGAKALVDAVGAGVNVGLVSFEDDGDEVTDATLADSNSDVKTAIDNLSAGGSTAIGAGITLGQDNLDGTVGSGARNGAAKYLVVLADGGENEGTDPVGAATTAKNAGTTIYSIAYGSGADNNLMEDISSPPKVDDGTIDDQDEFAFVADTTDVEQVFSGIGGDVTQTEEIFFQGPLRAALTALTDGNGIPLDGDGGDDFDEINDDPSADTRGCFQPDPATNCIGFSWWLPTDHGNEVQGDSVSFDLGFYTEQCRHNDGGGMNNEAVSDPDQVDA